MGAVALLANSNRRIHPVADRVFKHRTTEERFVYLGIATLSFAKKADRKYVVYIHGGELHLMHPDKFFNGDLVEEM